MTVEGNPYFNDFRGWFYVHTSDKSRDPFVNFKDYQTRIKSKFFTKIMPSISASSTVPVTIYKIPLMCLVGQIASDKTAANSLQPQTLLSPLVNTPASDGNGGGANGRPKSPTGRRSPLLRTKKMGVYEVYID